MPCIREYHSSVRHWIPASVAVLGLMFLPTTIPCASAQINGVPASVTSPGFGGRAINGTPPSVSSVGPRGFVPNPSIQPFTSVPHHDRDHQRHRRSQNVLPLWGGYYAYPLVPYAPESQSDAEDDDANYQGGPTIFDRRGSGPDAYIPPVQNAAPAHASQNTSVEGVSEAPQTPTVLIYKDGHQLELQNYAIVGQTLYDLTPGHPRKIALADLDLDATQKLNDDRGVSFQLPPAQGS